MDMLRRDPNDREGRWLLNLAHMTLGNWPAGVPKELLVPPERFASEHELPRFRDVAVECGLGIPTTSGGICAEDFDRDGFLDVLRSEEHTSESSHSQISYAVFCLKKKKDLSLHALSANH